MNPKLIVMAAGLGSRFGGLKQMESMTAEGEIILDFSCYDAWKAGFEEIVFVIKPEMEEDFNERVLKRMSKHVKVSYVFQTLNQLPAGYSIPEGRVKPWGTGHAVMVAKDMIDGPFAVINADDYYGADAFKKVYDFLCSDQDENSYCMAGYYVQNTLSDTGTVTRGVCKVDEDNNLIGINETTDIGWICRNYGKIGVIDDESDDVKLIDQGTYVSMNFWGFKKSMMDTVVDGFPAFLDQAMESNPLKSEYLLPAEVGKLLDAGTVSVKVLEATDKWYGVTYKEDKETVVAALAAMKDAGKYPKRLWD